MKLMFKGKEVVAGVYSAGDGSFSIEIATPPSKTSYYAGELFIPAGMVVQVKFSNGFAAVIPHEYLTFSPSGELSLDDNRITATFQSGGIQLVVNQDISVEEMPEFEWWTPEMTSDTTPEPYKATASTYLSDGVTTFYPFMSFNANLNKCWHSTGGTNQWLQIDFGGPIRFTSFRMTPSNCHPTHVNYMPRNFLIECRNGSVWETVKTYSNITGWKITRQKRLILWMIILYSQKRFVSKLHPYKAVRMLLLAQLSSVWRVSK